MTNTGKNMNGKKGLGVEHILSAAFLDVSECNKYCLAGVYLNIHSH